MIKRDFILRLIERAAEFVLKAAGLRKNGQHEEAQQTISEGFKSLLGLDANLASAMATEDLIMILGNDPGKLLAAAKLLEVDPATRIKALTIQLTVHFLPGKSATLDRTEDVHRLLKEIGESGETLPSGLEELVRRFEA